MIYESCSALYLSSIIMYWGLGPFRLPAYLFVLGELRFETVDLTTRLLIPIIVLQNHNRYNIMVKGHNYSIDIEAIEAEVRN